jgi:1-acyl-sn-glycerol-3-phosphate acyltransferase
MGIGLQFCLIALCMVVLLLTIGWFNRLADWGSPWLNALHGLNRLFCLHYHRLQSGSLVLPEGQAILLASNHTAGLDPMLIVAVSTRPIRFLVDREEYERFGLHWVFRAMGCIPVTMDRRPQSSFYEALKQLEAGEVVAIFPQGGLDPGARFKRGVTKLAVLSGIAVSPLRISGVGSPGSVARSIFVRSQARIEGGQAITVTEENEQEALSELEEYLLNRPS